MHDLSNRVLLLHTLGGNARTWAPVVDAGADPARFLAVDLPGHGAHGEDPFDLATAVTSVHAALDECGPAPVHLVGSGLGALVALRVLADAPHRLVSLLLAGFPPGGDPGRLRATADALRTKGMAGFAADYLAATLVTGTGPDSGSGSGPDGGSGSGSNGGSGSGSGSGGDSGPAELTASMTGMRPEAFLGSLEAALVWETPVSPGPVPCRVLRGEHDIRVTEQAARALATRLGADYIGLPGAGHIAYVDDPRGFRELMDAFHRVVEERTAVPGTLSPGSPAEPVLSQEGT
ncbi:alpha/beta fold hydrolase [Streptosporangium sp. V21-05]|uniref:alpha/beta fold hydrolase n=1 Tax=Streptosporangium sp. V21-05 TaxID=3446115 RepID=UPI003F53A637